MKTREMKEESLGQFYLHSMPYEGHKPSFTFLKVQSFVESWSWNSTFFLRIHCPRMDQAKTLIWGVQNFSLTPDMKCLQPR